MTIDVNMFYGLACLLLPWSGPAPRASVGETGAHRIANRHCVVARVLKRHEGCSVVRGRRVQHGEHTAHERLREVDVRLVGRPPRLAPNALARRRDNILGIDAFERRRDT